MAACDGAECSYPVMRVHVYLSSMRGTALERPKSASKRLQERASVGQGW
jgi:hypothetical protein